METLNYIGSKKKLFNKILQVCQENIKDLDKQCFADLFSGTGTVVFNMNNYCNKIIANDLEYYSYVINYALLKCNYTNKIQNIIDEMNNLEQFENGLIFKNFSNNENCERMFFINDNAKKSDAIRLYLNEILEKKIIENDEYYWLLY